MIPLKDLKDALLKRELEEGLNFCSQSLNPQSIPYNDLLLLRQQLAEQKRLKRIAVITLDDYNRACNRIRLSATEVIDRIEKEDLRLTKEEELIRDLKEENAQLRQRLVEQEKVIITFQNFVGRGQHKSVKSLNGYYLEFIPDLVKAERPFSIGEFVYNKSIQEFQYNGANYYMNGKKYNEWHSDKLFVDYRKDNILYFFTTTSKNRMHEMARGSGLIKFKRNHKDKLWVESGYFSDEKGDQKLKHHEIYNLEKVTKALNQVHDVKFNAANVKHHKEIIKLLAETWKSDATFFEKVA